MATKSQIDKVWDKARTIPAKHRSKYRRDPYGNVMYHHSYDKHSPMGWELDDIKPRSRGGSPTRRNLQALNTKVTKIRQGFTKVMRRRFK